MQYILGTAILGSLLFIPFPDAIPVVVKYVASGIVSRAILGYELSSLSRLNKEVMSKDMLELRSNDQEQAEMEGQSKSLLERVEVGREGK